VLATHIFTGLQKENGRTRKEGTPLRESKRRLVGEDINSSDVTTKEVGNGTNGIGLRTVSNRLKLVAFYYVVSSEAIPASYRLRDCHREKGRKKASEA